MSATTHRPRGVRLHVRRGMTLVEVMIAVFILAVGLLALAGVGTSVQRQVAAGGLATKASLIAQSRFDSLTSLACVSGSLGGLGSGDVTGTTTPTPGITERWSVTDGVHIKTLRDTIIMRGRTNPLSYESVIPCRD